MVKGLHVTFLLALIAFEKVTCNLFVSFGVMNQNSKRVTCNLFGKLWNVWKPITTKFAIGQKRSHSIKRIAHLCADRTANLEPLALHLHAGCLSQGVTWPKTGQQIIRPHTANCPPLP